MHFGKRLKILRTKSGLTQEECAERLGVTRQTLSAWETGRSHPDVRVAAEIAELFAVPFDSLIPDAAEKPPAPAENAAGTEGEGPPASAEDTANAAAGGKTAAGEDRSAEKKRRLTVYLSVLVYLTVWAAVVASFWLLRSAGSIDYPVLASALLLLGVTLAASFLIGLDKVWLRTKWLFALFFGFFYFLTGVLTRDLSALLTRGTFPAPQCIHLLPGVLVSAVGIVLGESLRVLRKIRKKPEP